MLTQHRTDPRLGPLGLEFLQLGLSPEETIKALVASTPHHGWRQLAVLDAKGRSAHYSGGNIRSIHAGVSGKDCVAVGNVIRSTEVPAAMVRAFEEEPENPLGDRLCAALKAGHDAGGEFKQVTSTGLLVFAEHPSLTSTCASTIIRTQSRRSPGFGSSGSGRGQLRQAGVRARQSAGQCLSVGYLTPKRQRPCWPRRRPAAERSEAWPVCGLIAIWFAACCLIPAGVAAGRRAEAHLPESDWISQISQEMSATHV